VLTKLIQNGVQAMDRGGHLTLRTGGDNGMVQISVSDTGVGIPPEELDRIFEAFYTTKPEGEGTGLGLSICRRIVEEHGGRIEVESEVQRGSTFTVLLPAGEGIGGEKPSTVSTSPH